MHVVTQLMFSIFCYLITAICLVLYDKRFGLLHDNVNEEAMTFITSIKTVSGHWFYTSSYYLHIVIQVLWAQLKTPGLGMILAIFLWQSYIALLLWAYRWSAVHWVHFSEWANHHCYSYWWINRLSETGIHWGKLISSAARRHSCIYNIF